MTKPKATPHPDPANAPAPAMLIDTPELIARFQLDTEQAIAAVKAEHLRAFADLERKIASIQDEWNTTREEVRALKVTIEDGLHQMRAGVREAINAQKEAVTAAVQAGNAAAVFDKLKASQPDFHRMVKEQNVTIAKLTDKFTHLDEQLHGLSKKLDEFDIVAEDYEETKGTIRGMDLIVKDLNADHKQRRRSGVNT
jgi:chromosome segregation ATPase